MNRNIRKDFNRVMSELDEFIEQVYNELGLTDAGPIEEQILKARLRRRIARLGADQRIRLLMYLR